MAAVAFGSAMPACMSCNCQKLGPYTILCTVGLVCRHDMLAAAETLHSASQLARVPGSIALLSQTKAALVPT